MSETGNVAPVEAKAVLVDAETMRAVWLNESARSALADPDVDIHSVTIDQVIPSADQMSLEDVTREVARTGEARHRRASLMASRKGVLSIVVSVYRLPDGHVLLLADTSYSPQGYR